MIHDGKIHLCKDGVYRRVIGLTDEYVEWQEPKAVPAVKPRMTWVRKEGLRSEHEHLFDNSRVVDSVRRVR